MKQFTQTEFDNLPIIDGRKQCPTGDYTLIRSFGACCSFGDGCRFDAWSSFGNRCWFSAGCYFSHGCTFGVQCGFGLRCTFGVGCVFSSMCRFGRGCTFGVRCTFGEMCKLGEGCAFDGKTAKAGNPYIAVDRCGSNFRKTYLFNFEDGIFVRSGCFFGTVDEFLTKALEDCGGDVTAKKYRQYVAAVALAVISFDD